MQTMPNVPSADVAPFSLTSFLFRHRTWMYAALFLLAATLLLVDQRRETPAGRLETRASVASSAASPAAQPAAQDDRPLLTPDR
jgi:hypothetical protein